MRFSSSIGIGLVSLGCFACQARVVVGDLGSNDAGASSMMSLGGSGGETAPTGVGVGGVASSGSSVGGSSGSSSEACANDLTHFIPAPLADCPDSVPEALDPCDVPEGTVCTWQIQVGQPDAGFEVLACYLHDGEKAWFGWTEQDGKAGGVNNELCSHTPVEANASCDGHVDQLCKYDSETCVCDSATTTWACQPGASKISSSLPAQVERLCVPFDETKLVKDLTPAEANAWCTWSIDPLGQGADPSLLAPAAPPFQAQNSGVLFGDVAGDVCLPVIAVNACAANLTVAPDCDATVGELDDCLETLRGRNRVAEGCESLLANPNCTGVLALRVPNAAPCPLPFP